VTTWWDEQTDERRTTLTDVLHSPRGQQHLRYAGGAVGFAAWLLVADLTCARRFGVSIFDLSDWTWRDAYDAGDLPGDAVREAIEADDTYGMLLGGSG
jgi:hypothetical protein